MIIDSKDWVIYDRQADQTDKPKRDKSQKEQITLQNVQCDVIWTSFLVTTSPYPQCGSNAEVAAVTTKIRNKENLYAWFLTAGLQFGSGSREFC